ncbi:MULTISPECIES: hypothetical protein [unclassified Microbacterium]|uniref:hypothetical protein n=1 Tax=unclassified Microbacterium TaxID=2609290 RepID=UPI000EA89CEB|nr:MULTISPECIES: hypothetical protein [unclassified Microbacterium]MBT2485052.1 hypothetical protein [Microbacterium sp. ISL-108]RKN67899.1 hypothetical protein D7252_10060 [Microbacterium sp. CGR2]
MSADDEWTTLLEQLEKDAERILQGRASEPGAHPVASGALDTWTPPATPLPLHLADRAQRLVTLQRSAMERAAADMGELRQHLDAVRRVPADRRPDAPAYLDVNG